MDSARPLGRLHLFTEEGEPEVYLLQEELTTAPGVSWVKLRIPARPNGGTGWVPLRALGPMHLTDWALRVNLRLLRATLYRDARPVWSAPVGVGAPGTPTPTGHFWVRELFQCHRRHALRSVRLRNKRLLGAERMAGRRRRRHPRDESTRARSRASVPRLHPHAQRRHHLPRPPHAGGRPREHLRLSRTGPHGTLPSRGVQVEFYRGFSSSVDSNHQRTLANRAKRRSMGRCCAPSAALRPISARGSGVRDAVPRARVGLGFGAHERFASL